MHAYIYTYYTQVPALAAVAKMLSPTAHSLAGGALSLLLVFRTNSSYNRFYEARCLWGKVTNTIREMARFAHTNLSGVCVCERERERERARARATGKSWPRPFEPLCMFAQCMCA